MRKPKMFGLCGLLLLMLTWPSLATAEGTFEDADKANDVVSSSSNEQYDLRHTIPGEPGVDYPIYHAIPKTSFECTGRHEGYYADVETRCQAFRICAHTARSKQGFGFLCPNGTLFNQRHFVCDWYRNVNCDDSESFYGMNDANRVGSNYDMMETVRQMMEYPMKTIAKALQQTSSSSASAQHGAVVKRPNAGGEAQQTVAAVESAKKTERKPIANRGQMTYSGRKTAVTKEQVESAYNYAKGQTTGTGAALDEETKTHSEDAKPVEKSSAPKSNVAATEHEEEDVFVNSLGELSTDPGVNFIRTNAHIIAEPHRALRKKMNFAEKVNAGLNNLAELPAGETLAPEYVKQLRQQSGEVKMEAIAAAPSDLELAANINGLLDEVVTEITPPKSGYELKKPSKHAFMFLSRGFSSQSSSKGNKDGPYQYVKPKQTASTIRFSPNEIPSDTNKVTKHLNTALIDDEAKAFGFVAETTEAPPSQSFLDFDESYLSKPWLPPFEEGPKQETESSSTAAPTEEPLHELQPLSIHVEEDSQNSQGIELATEAPVATITTPAAVSDESTTTKTASTTTESPSDDLIAEQDDEELDTEKLDVNKRANNLLLAGVKLTEQEPHNETTTQESISLNPSITQILLESSTTSTEKPTVAISTETVTEVSSTQERIKSFRRFATLNRASATKPLIYGKRGSLTLTSTTPAAAVSSTTKSPTTTKSYLKRVAASRLRLSRLTMARGTTVGPTSSTTEAPVTSTTSATTQQSATKSEEKNKRVLTRDLERDTAVLGSGPEADSHEAAASSGVATWETVRNNLQRYQITRKRSGNTGYSYAAAATTTPRTTAATTRATSTSATHSLRTVTNRGRARYSNFRTQSTTSRESSRSSSTTSRPHSRQHNRNSHHHSQTQTVSSQSTHTSSPSEAPLAGSYQNSLSASSATEATGAQHHQGRSRTASTGLGSSVQTSVSSSSSSSTTSSSKSPAASLTAPASATGAYLSFDKLTRAIVDDSVLQNFRSTQAGRTSTSFRSSSSTSSSSASSRSLGSAQSSSTSSFGASNNKGSISGFSTPTKSPSVQGPTAPTPRIVIARAEGQRIEPNSVTSIISSLVGQQPKPAASSSYVPLDNFLTKKFGNVPVSGSSSFAEPQQQQQQQQQAWQQQQQQQRQQELQRQQQQQQQERLRQQQQRQQEELRRQQEQQRIREEQQRQEEQRHQQEQLRLQQQLQQQQQLQHQQQLHKQQQLQQQQEVQLQQQQLAYIQPQQQQQQQQTRQQPKPTQPEQQWSIFSHQQYLQHQLGQQGQQQQQQQLRQQPQQQQQTVYSTHTQQQQQQQQQIPQNYYLQQQQQQQPQSQQQQNQYTNAYLLPGTISRDSQSAFLNVQLPTLPNGLIPAATTQVAQKRSDLAAEELELTSVEDLGSLYAGGPSSYDVSLGSIGRLPNDITHLLKRLRRH